MSVFEDIKYVLASGDLFLQDTHHYGYTTNNNGVFEAVFTKQLSKAQTFSKSSAINKIKEFKSENFIVRGGLKIDVLEIKEIKVSLK